MWALEPAHDNTFRIKNRWKNTYLNNQNEKLTAGNVEPGWWSAMWRIQDVGGNQFQLSKAQHSAEQGVAATSKVGKEILASPGKQCVKAVFGVGYAAKVRWYEPQNVIYDPVTEGISLRPNAKTYKTENIAVLQTSCVESEKKMVAQVSVVGGEIANQSIALAAGTAVAVASGVAGAVGCVGTAGAGCPAAAAGIGAAVSGAVSAASMALPDSKGTFYLGSPGKLEISGTVWSPSYAEVREYGKGKQAGASCESNTECANDTCGRESAADGNKSICCPSGQKGLYAGHEYYYGLKKGTTCWSSAMCASGTCGGNLGGLQRGTYE